MKGGEREERRERGRERGRGRERDKIRMQRTCFHDEYQRIQGALKKRLFSIKKVEFQGSAEQLLELGRGVFPPKTPEDGQASASRQRVISCIFHPIIHTSIVLAICPCSRI